MGRSNAFVALIIALSFFVTSVQAQDVGNKPLTAEEHQAAALKARTEYLGKIHALLGEARLAVAPNAGDLDNNRALRAHKANVYILQKIQEKQAKLQGYQTRNLELQKKYAASKDDAEKTALTKEFNENVQAYNKLDAEFKEFSPVANNAISALAAMETLETYSCTLNASVKGRALQKLPLTIDMVPQTAGLNIARHKDGTFVLVDPNDREESDAYLSISFPIVLGRDTETVVTGISVTGSEISYAKDAGFPNNFSAQYSAPYKSDQSNRLVVHIITAQNDISVDCIKK
jgi:hypothetical protein